MRLFCPPNPLPRSGGRGVSEVAKFNNHAALNRFHLIPSPPMGERVRGEGEVIFLEQEVLTGTFELLDYA